MEFLDYYRDNLYYIRALAAEFAAEFPKIAGRLSLSEFDCQDPYIERLLEGTAFLAAKTEKKMDDGYFVFLESILNSISPSEVYPVPSGGVLEVSPAQESDIPLDGVSLEEGTQFTALIPSINTPCKFLSIANTPLSYFKVSGAEYLVRNLSCFGIKEKSAESALHITLKAQKAGALCADSFAQGIRFFFNAPEADVSLLFRLLMHNTVSVHIKDDNGDFSKLSDAEFDLPVSLGGKIFEQTNRSSTRGLRLLKNYLSYPDFFKFFTLKGTDNSGGSVESIEIVVFFSRKELQLQNSVTASSIKTNCVPVLNVFSKRSDRIVLDKQKYEIHIIPERTSMRDYEVLNIKKIDFYDERNQNIFSAVNFYEDAASGKEIRNFFSVKRRTTLVDETAQKRSSYRGTEVFVSFAPNSEKLQNAYQFMADLVVTNRDLPLLLRPDTVLSSDSALIEEASFVTPPTRPALPLIMRGNNTDYSRLSHIILNLSAVFWQTGKKPQDMFKELLRAYQIRSAEETEKMVLGLVTLEAESAAFTFIKNGMVFFEWGWRVRFSLDEIAFTGMGYYMFARIIAEMLKSFAAVNTPLEIEFSTEQGGRIAVWKTFDD
ncbi:MAG: type VI secretion system baseplate subunit TssF [Spirochaetaceae bacterium]|jgi:type VI secretion system VasI/ImpG family protein|nr:type VI secretion system baseplate subunit TssF [Spirochaetaceae bacterium]